MKAILVSIFFAYLIACFSFDKTVNTGEEFVLKKNETVKINGTNLKLKMLAAGQAQTGAGDVPFCEFTVEINSRTEDKTLDIGKTTTAGDFNVKLRSIDTTADPKAADPWSNTSCGFVVTKKKLNSLC